MRPAYHITLPANWMNDPNGLMQYNGVFHVFYQFNPLGAVWAAPYWGHMASKDLVHWKRLPAALVPDTSYDYDGAFSGSATVLPNKGPVVMYTGVSKFSELGAYYQVQSLARPANTSDPLLVRWVKADENPVIPNPPPGGTNLQFRDPETAWLQETADGDVWLTTVGAQVDCVGSAPLYASRDFAAWEFYGYLHSQPGVAPSPPGAKCVPDGGEGEGRMWESVGFRTLQTEDGVVYVFKYSDQVKGRVPRSRDWYVLSDVPLNFTGSAVVGEGNAFAPEFRGRAFDPKLVDFGDIYASKFVKIDDGRTLWMGWSYETSIGCRNTCARGTRLTKVRGVQTILREVSIDAETAELLMYPIAELEALRTRSLYSGRAVAVAEGDVVDVPLDFPKGPSFRGRQMDVVANFTLTLPPGNAAQFTIGVELYTGFYDFTPIFFIGSLSSGASGPVVDDVEMWLHRSRSGGYTGKRGRMQGGRVTTPSTSPTNVLSLRLLVDHSIVEVFAQGGRVRTTSHIYPRGEDNWGLMLVNHAEAGPVDVSVDIDVWDLESAFYKTGFDDLDDSGAAEVDHTAWVQ